MHAFEAAVKAGREPFKVKDLSQAEFGRKEIRLAEQEMPGLMAIRAALREEEAARRNADHGQPAHDDSDGRADRNARRARRRRALGVVQHLLDAGSCRRGGRRRPPRDGRHAANPKGIPVFAWKGETLEEYWWCTSEALDGPMTPARRRSSMTAATPRCWCTRASNSKRPGKVPAFKPDERSRRVGRHPRPAARPIEGAPALVEDRQRRSGRLRRDDNRRASPLSDGGSRQAALPCHQRQ